MRAKGFRLITSSNKVSGVFVLSADGVPLAVPPATSASPLDHRGLCRASSNVASSCPARLVPFAPLLLHPSLFLRQREPDHTGCKNDREWK